MASRHTQKSCTVPDVRALVHFKLTPLVFRATQCSPGELHLRVLGGSPELTGINPEGAQATWYLDGTYSGPGHRRLAGEPHPFDLIPDPKYA